MRALLSAVIYLVLLFALCVVMALTPQTEDERTNWPD